MNELRKFLPIVLIFGFYEISMGQKPELEVYYPDEGGLGGEPLWQ